MFSRSNTSQNRLQSINLSIDIGVAIFITLLKLSFKVTCRVPHMFLKIICWQILSWTQLHIVNLRITSPCNIFFLSMSCVSRRYIRDFIDKNNFITRKKKCTRGISSSTEIFSSHISVFPYDFVISSPCIFITWPDLKFMIFFEINGRCNSIISNARHPRVFIAVTIMPSGTKSFRHGSLTISTEFVLGY